MLTCTPGFRDKARNDFVAGRNITSETQYNAQLEHATEVAKFLRVNLVQGVNSGENDVWSEQFFLLVLFIAAITLLDILRASCSFVRSLQSCNGEKASS